MVQISHNAFVESVLIFIVILIRCHKKTFQEKNNGLLEFTSINTSQEVKSELNNHNTAGTCSSAVSYELLFQRRYRELSS